MVKVSQTKSDNDKLRGILNGLCEKYGFRLLETGWARTTFDVHKMEPQRKLHLLVRVESFATTSGEIRLFDAEAADFANELGVLLERTFPAVSEATVIKSYSE
ncbi:MAG: hypothetical protein AMS15_00900 [Planctomycetes bacterium DG_23]|nr:MAG: hypothetical protein AMS15_00900 [Planctomycetes bacterium DG_23]